MKTPKITLIKVANSINHRLTGATAKEYRNLKRIKLAELAPRLTSPLGNQMTVANLSLYEGGKAKWTQEFFNSYIATVDELANAFA